MDNAIAQSGYLRNILEQPQAVRDTLAEWQESDELRAITARLPQFNAVILTGMGASYSALHPLVLKLIAHGIKAQAIETSELLYHAPRLLDSRNLVIAVSQSGQSVEIVKVAERKSSEKFTLIGVTNTPHSPLAAASDAVVMTYAGAEYSVSSKTYLATLAALELLGAALTLAPSPRAELEQAASAIENYLTHWQTYVDDLAKQLQDIETIVVVGRGASLAAAGTGGLIIREAAWMPALDMSSAAFRHGPMELISPGLFVLVFDGTAPTIEQNRRLVQDIRALGGYAASVGESNEGNVFALPQVAAEALPLLEILVPQMMSLALARLRGHVPGDFRYSGKITLTE